MTSVPCMHYLRLAFFLFYQPKLEHSIRGKYLFRSLVKYKGFNKKTCVRNEKLHSFINKMK